MNADQPARPANILNIVAINQGLRPLTMGEPEVRWITPAAVADAEQAGALIVDTRPSAAFGSAHIPRALNIQLTAPEFEQRVGWITPVDVPIVLVVASADLAPRALRALAFLGLDGRVTGVLEGGMERWTAEGLPTVALPQMTARDLQERLSSGDRLHVLDVREPAEWNEGHIAGAHLESHRLLPQRIHTLPFDRDAPIAVICHSGARSSIASSVLQHHGFRRVTNVTGGMTAWREAGLPMVAGGPHM